MYQSIARIIVTFIFGITIVSGSSYGFGEEYDYIPTIDDSPEVQKWVEPLFNIITSYHVMSIPHEAIHAGVSYAFGDKTKYWKIGILEQSVYIEDNSSRLGITLSSLSAPLFTRLTSNWPKSVLGPELSNFQSRWSGTFSIMSYGTHWYTISQIPRHRGDFYRAALAISEKKRDQNIFYGIMGCLLVWDIYNSWDDISNNFDAMMGNVRVRHHPVKSGLSLNVLPTGISATYNF